MANREELAIIRSARAGQAAAQLELGRLYLCGSAGLPQSLPTALHWLERAARQDCQPAWQLIGDHIPFELALRSGTALAHWYERAYDDGSIHAGLVYAQLALDPAAGAGQPQPKAVRALEDAARAGFAHAKWLLSQQAARDNGKPAQPSAQDLAPANAAAYAPARPASRAAPAPSIHDAAAWPAYGAQGAHGIGAAGRAATSVPGDARRLAGSAVAVAQATLDSDWAAGRWDDYLATGLPLARTLAAERLAQDDVRRLAPDEIALLSRCARLLDPALTGAGCGGVCAATAAPRLQPGEPALFWELAAAEHDRHAQLALGLRCARMRVDGQRNAAAALTAPVASFKKAIRWLTLAGEQGLAEAWYALSRIYIKPEFSQRNVANAGRYLERAADMGYRDAQLECGHNAWRARRETESNDVRAVYWLQKAAAQGAGAAAALLRKIAPRAATPPYLETGRLLGSHGDLLAAHPLLAARIELAALFALSRAEALLLDVVAADQGHCLVVDIRASYGRSKRRLILMESTQQRHALDRIVALFSGVDCGPAGPEGNYRQRLYRLRTLVGTPAGADKEADEGIGLAA